MKYVYRILVALSAIMLIVGLFLTNGAPQQAVGVAAACYIAIMARIAQASSKDA